MLAVSSIAAPARAAQCPFPVEDMTANDNPTNFIRLVTPALTDENSIRRYDFEGQFTIDCDWFGVGMRFNQVYVPFGLTTNLTYHVSSAAGLPLLDQQVRLRVNKGYSSSNAAVRVNGIKARLAPQTAADGANVIGTTDVNGNVTFVVQSPTDCKAYGGTLPAAPTNPGAQTPHDRNRDASTDCFSQIMPSIAGEKLDSTDWIEIHYFDPTNLNYGTSPGESFLLAPVLDSTNSIQTPDVISAYTPVGSGQNLAFAFRDASGNYLRNRHVQVRVNASESGSNALVGAGIFGVDGFGNSVATSSPSASELTLNGVTDAFGTLVIFLKNSDVSGEPKPQTLTSPVPTSNRKFTSIIPQFFGSNAGGTSINLHYASGLKLPGQLLSAPLNVRVSAVGLSVTVSWTNDPDNQGLTNNEVYDSQNNLVCSAGPEQSCSFSWNIANTQGVESYYVVPRAESVEGPASGFTDNFAPSSLKPALYAPLANFTVGDTVPLLGLGFPANTVAYLRDGLQIIQYRTNSAGVLSASYVVQKSGIKTLSLKAGTKSATLKIYSPADRVTSGFCKLGSSIKVSYSGTLPNSEVQLQVSDGRDPISAIADSKGNATATIACNQVGGYLWSATVGSLSLNSGGFTVR
jgi:hypothetical protein